MPFVKIRHLLPAVLLGLLAPPAPAAIEIAFADPDSYTDAGDRGYGSSARQATLDALRAHLETLAARWLAPDQHLVLEILDVDLAGRFEPWRSYAWDLRVLRDITWPRIELRYTLTQNGEVLATGEEAVVDMTYLDHPNRYFDSDRLRYEKRMLDDWFRKRFGPPDRS
jgi:hypothetical protein